MFCGLLLHALGTDREVIIADYLLSDGRYSPARRAVVEQLVSRVIGIADRAPVSAVLNSDSGSSSRPLSTRSSASGVCLMPISRQSASALTCAKPCARNTQRRTTFLPSLQ
ncbi:MAG: tyrosine-protein phosphatase [Novosphingobium sp.]